MLDIFCSIPIPENNPESDNIHYMIQLGNYSYPLNGKLSAVIEKLDTNNLVHWASGGNWSMIDLFMGIMAIAKQGEVIISSYAFSEKPARIICDLVHEKVITSLYCLIDSRVDTRSASALTLIQNAATKCVLVDTHAKVTLIDAGTNKYTIVGSANYTTNRRYEAGFITMDNDTFNFHKNWIINAIDRRNTD